MARAHLRLSWIPLVLLAGAACGDSTPDADPSTVSPGRPVASSPETSAPSEEGTSSTAGLTYDQFCRLLGRKVTVTYTVVARPTSTGKDLFITLSMRNDFERNLLGSMGGTMAVTAVNRGSLPRYEWGGSSADFIGVRAFTTHRVRVWNLDPDPLSVPADAKVTALGVYSSLGPARTGRNPCGLVARLRAPRGLVIGHPSGHWRLSVDDGIRISNRAVHSRPRVVG